MKHINKIIALAALSGAVYSTPSEAAVQCQSLGAQACLNALDALINSQSFVEAWATGAYNLYQSRYCTGGPSTNGLYTFYGRNVNKSGQMVNDVVPSISCNECEALSQISSTVSGGYLGECAPVNDDSWDFIGHFCEPPGPQGSLVVYNNLDLYTAATYFAECGVMAGVTTKSACSPSHGCLQ